MNKKIILVPIIAIIAIVLIGISSDETYTDNNIVFHATLADPDLYVNGAYTDTFILEEGKYTLRFVPNGSSPETLIIIINGETFDFSENFELVGTLQNTGVSEYHTWDYNGEKKLSISQTQQITITINPNGQTKGSVSVDIIKE